MKIKCLECETIYDVQLGVCPACSARGGYMQEPKVKQVEGKTIHLEETLIHESSKNEYQIKEIQTNGLIAILTKSPIVEFKQSKTRVYISNTQINEYKTK